MAKEFSFRNSSNRTAKGFLVTKEAFNYVIRAYDYVIKGYDLILSA